MNDVSKILREAWAAVEAASLPPELQPTAFEAAIHLLGSARQPVAGQGGGAGERVTTAGDADSSSNAGAVTISESEIYDRVVTQTGIERHKLEQLVHLDDDGPRITLPGLKLGKTSAERTRAVAQILTIVRGFGLDEAETHLDVIRTECNRLRVLDPPNFSAHISKISGYVLTGSGQNRRLRAKAQGIQGFSMLVDTLTDAIA